VGARLDESDDDAGDDHGRVRGGRQQLHLPQAGAGGNSPRCRFDAGTATEGETDDRAARTERANRGRPDTGRADHPDLGADFGADAAADGGPEPDGGLIFADRRRATDAAFDPDAATFDAHADAHTRSDAHAIADSDPDPFSDADADP
jgi:hypothetical protein